MVPGKKYTPEDLLEIASRRWWLIIVPFVIVAAGTAIEARFTPDQYRSETLILVVPQRIPESYVRATVTSRIEDRLNSISQQILSRTRLERIILDYNLYAAQRRSMAMENLVEVMRKNITVETVKGDAFRVIYVSVNPEAAQKVTNRLASLFIEENRRDREVLADGTNQFIESQLEDARRRLAEHEKKVEEYRQRYSGELPSQVEANLQVIQNTQLQVQSLVESIGRDHDRRLVLERTISDAAMPTAGAETPTDAPPRDSLEEARNTLHALEGRYKPEHPDVVRARRHLRDLEAARASEPQAPVAAAAPAIAMSPGDAARQARLRDLRAEMLNLDRQIVYKESEERRLRGVMAAYQARVEAAPARESELIALTRDYSTLQQVYTNLLTKREDSKVAANLERRQAGEQFRVLDPARVPERPFSPNRNRMNAMGAVAGLGIGLGLVALLEYRDTSLRTDEDVLTSIRLPLLAMIPVMTTAKEQRSRRRARWIVSLSAAAAMLLCGAVLVWKLAGR